METAYRSTIGRSAAADDDEDDDCVSPNIRVRCDCGRVPTKNGISWRKGRASARVRFNGFARSESFDNSSCVCMWGCCMYECELWVWTQRAYRLHFDLYYNSISFTRFLFHSISGTFSLLFFLSSIFRVRLLHFALSSSSAYIVRYVWIDGCEQTSDRVKWVKERDPHRVRARSYERRGTTKQTWHEWSDRMVYWYHVHAQRTSFFYLLIELVHLISAPSRRRLPTQGRAYVAYTNVFPFFIFIVVPGMSKAAAAAYVVDIFRTKSNRNESTYIFQRDTMQLNCRERRSAKNERTDNNRKLSFCPDPDR